MTILYFTDLGAQTCEIDSLRSILSTENDARLKVDVFYALSQKFLDYDIKESLKFVEAAVSKAFNSYL